MTRDELKAIVRTEPSIRATHAEWAARLAELTKEYDAARQRCTELDGQLVAIAIAKVELAASGVPTETVTGEPVPVPTPADKPKRKGK